MKLTSARAATVTAVTRVLVAVPTNPINWKLGPVEKEQIEN